jgi:hypothetical protein
MVQVDSNINQLWSVRYYAEKGPYWLEGTGSIRAEADRRPAHENIAECHPQMPQDALHGAK